MSNIDKIAPTAKVIYPAETQPTNQDVVVTIEPSEDVKITSQGGASHTFTDNGSFTFEFEDLAGNKGSAEATVSNIDKEPPTASIGYSTTSWVNTDMIATIVNPSEPIKVTNTADFNSAILSGSNVSNPGTQNANKSSKDYTIEGLVYTVTVTYIQALVNLSLLLIRNRMKMRTP